MPKSPFSPGSSRTAFSSVGRMPVIAEDDSLPAVTPPNMAALPPPTPCRSTKPKYYGRSPVPRAINSHPSYPPPAYSRSSSRDSTLSTLSTRSLLSAGSYGSRPSSGTSTPRLSPRNSLKDKSQLLPITTPVGPSSAAEKAKKGPWIVRRGNRYRTIVALILGIGLIVGLSVGLTVGMRSSSPSTTLDTTTNSTTLFPSGSFAFNTALLESNTGCTANPSTWRCYPYQNYSQSANDSLASFFWTISPKNSYTYQVSSSSNPFAPQFTNQTMVLLEGNTLNERLVFNFSLPKTVVPSEAITEDGRAATCTFSDTAFRATLWTRRNTTTPLGTVASGVNATSTDGNVKWGPWPGQVEIVQVKKGGPECQDKAGNAVTIAAGREQCKCRYANYDLTSQQKTRRDWQA
ncbi:tat pathway signal sequence [Colletotrichum lupini]|uniref:Tat pathway signal sequence n=1 Tax=Colletotrichum lupini TaxID=145971 RepID=A0A9Q8WMG4_9PEZI|nr:tat pathway signal sequence [Colletotrichum lupini]KAK1704233.1 hypothetical protein BDP67DRAFT_418609 [Colletotrichum lupini]UQC88267.1 tat pathway signal sequence [Colletotrichum lupini]